VKCIRLIHCILIEIIITSKEKVDAWNWIRLILPIVPVPLQTCMRPCILVVPGRSWMYSTPSQVTAVRWHLWLTAMWLVDLKYPECVPHYLPHLISCFCSVSTCGPNFMKIHVSFLAILLTSNNEEGGGWKIMSFSPCKTLFVSWAFTLIIGTLLIFTTISFILKCRLTGWALPNLQWAVISNLFIPWIFLCTV